MFGPLLLAELILGLLASAFSLAGSPPVITPETPVRVTICEIKRDPARYNRKLVEVTGFISHGFEDFTLLDPTCEIKETSIWLEYGGRKASNTMYCCGLTPGHTRPKVISVENIEIPLVDDDRFKQFDRMIQTKYDLVMRATIVGRFFSGEKVRYPAGEFWSSYGHMGCCSLMMIQQVISVDPHNNSDLDYRSASDQPNIEAGCGYDILRDNVRFGDLIESQRASDAGTRVWAFSDPRRVAVELLKREGNVEINAADLTESRRGAGRILYQWKPENSAVNYMVVVSRPYVLSFYARDSNKVAWCAIAAYRISCGNIRE